MENQFSAGKIRNHSLFSKKRRESIRIAAPSSVALIEMSRFLGNVRLKVSASVRNSVPIPRQFLVIFPTSFFLSTLITLKSRSWQQAQLQQGPSMMNTFCPVWFFTSNSERVQRHTFATTPTGL